MKPKSHQLRPQPGQSALYVQSASSSEVGSWTLGVPPQTLLFLFAGVKGGAPAGEVPQPGQDHLHRPEPVSSTPSGVSFCSLVCFFCQWTLSGPQLLGTISRVSSPGMRMRLSWSDVRASSQLELFSALRGLSSDAHAP